LAAMLLASGSCCARVPHSFASKLLLIGGNAGGYLLHLKVFFVIILHSLTHYFNGLQIF